MAGKGSKGGVPFKFEDEETATILLDSVAAGMPDVMACKRAGVHPTSLCDWKVRAKAYWSGDAGGSKKCAEFIERLQKSEMDAVFLRLQNISVAGMNGQWQADMTVLERRYPEYFGRKDRVQAELTGANGGPVEMNHSGKVSLGLILDDPEACRLATELEQRLSENAETPDGDRQAAGGADTGGPGEGTD